MKIKVGVIFGGNSVEHEVSVISALQAMEYIDREKYEVIPIYITKDKKWYTGKFLDKTEYFKDLEEVKKKNTNVVLINDDNHFYLQSLGFLKKYIQELDIVFPVVHGTNMEDGVLQGYLQTIGIPFVGSDCYASVVGQDKVLQKLVYKDNNLPITDFVWFYDIDYTENKDEIITKCENLKYPLVVKPACLGSSVGIKFVKNNKELQEAIENAITYDKKILVEKAVENLKEVNISLVGDYKKCELSVIEEVTTSNNVLTFKDKYLSGGKKKPSKGMLSLGRKIPAELDKKTEELVRLSAENAFKKLAMSGVSRIDYLIDGKTNDVYINEINTCPGSLSFYLWEPMGKKYKELINEIIRIAIKKNKEDNEKIHSFESNILDGYKGSKGLKK